MNEMTNITPEQSTGVSALLADYVLSSRFEDVPAVVRAEAVRTWLNWVGVAVGGCRHESIDIVFEAFAPFAGVGTTSILGRSEKTDPLQAALINGISSHVFDFDDTHLHTVIHPAGPVAAAITALAEHKQVTGAEFLHALILGIEVECRLGNAVYPDHYDVGWHITGSTGVMGAAMACGKLLGLSAQQLRFALGIAATQSSGLREMFGSMCKSFHVGNAAKNGLTSALLASKGFTSSEQAIEAKRGWANTLSTKQDYAEISEGLGETFEVSLNTYKPFACGIVIHPAIDGCVQLRNEHGLKAGDIERIDLTVHPLVLELTGKAEPRVGLEGKFSIYHSCAVAIIHGKAGEAQYSDSAVNDPTAIDLRRRVHPLVDEHMPKASVKIVVTTHDGRTLEKFIEHALGSLEKPMTDTQLDAKFTDLCEPILGSAGTDKLIQSCRTVETLTDVTNLIALATISQKSSE